MKQIWLKKYILSDKSLSANAILVYLGIVKITSNTISIVNKENFIDCLSIDRIVFSILGEQKYDDNIIKAVKLGFNELIERDIIKIVKEVNIFKSHGYIVDLFNVYLDIKKETFIVIEEDEVNKILNYNDRIDKRLSLLRYFIAVVSTFNHSNNIPDKFRGKIGGMSIEYLAQQSFISYQSALNYNRALENMQLLYIYRSADIMLFDNDKLKSIGNSYSRYRDSGLCKEYSLNYEQEYGHNANKIVSSDSVSQANNKRMLSQIYNRMCKGFTYDKHIVEEVEKYICNKNRVIQEKIDTVMQQTEITEVNKEYLDKLKKGLRDERIFQTVLTF